MPTLLTPEHFQLLSTRRLAAAVAEPDATPDAPAAGVERMAQMARFELRRRACSVPVRHRYASVTLRRAGEFKDTSA